MSRAVFLDRDGVINRTVLREGKPFPPSCARELEILPGVAEALSQLRGRDFRLIVVTNQPDVARGAQTRDEVEAMHGQLMATLPLDAILTCYHDGDGCDCRKPKPGALLNASRDFGIELERSFMVGDRWRDIAAGQQAGCSCLFIDYGYLERQPEGTYIRVGSLLEAANWIIAQEDITQDSSTASQKP